MAKAPFEHRCLRRFPAWLRAQSKRAGRAAVHTRGLVWRASLTGPNWGDSLGSVSPI